jgi:hypothetical protein
MVHMDICPETFNLWVAAERVHLKQAPKCPLWNSMDASKRLPMDRRIRSQMPRTDGSEVNCAVHIFVYDLLHFLWSFWLNSHPWNVIYERMYVCMYIRLTIQCTTQCQRWLRQSIYRYILSFAGILLSHNLKCLVSNLIPEKLGPKCKS